MDELADAARDMFSALLDAHYALDNLISERFEEPDEPCGSEELCGHDLCNECGCLRDKRARIAAALANASALIPDAVTKRRA